MTEQNAHRNSEHFEELRRLDDVHTLPIREDAAQDVPADEPGGDPACWLARVCPECGLFAEQDPPTRCSGCGTAIVAD